MASRDSTISEISVDRSLQEENHNLSGFERDRFRLGRELARDFEDASFSSVFARHDRPDVDDTETMGSFDISNDAQGVSTRKLDMLQQTPTIDSRMMKEQFADFSMAGDGADAYDTTDSYEVARGRHDPESILKSTDFSMHLPALNAQGSAKSVRKRAGGSLLDVDPMRRASISSAHSDPSDFLHRSGSGSNDNGKRKSKESVGLGSPLQKISTFPNIDFSPKVSTPLKRSSKSRLSPVGSGGSRERPSKIMDFVSTSSGGSRNKFMNPAAHSRDSEEDALSDIASISGRPRASNSRFRGAPTGSTKNPRPVSEPVTSGQNQDPIGDVPGNLAPSRKTISVDAIPKGFKSTDQFLRELGLNGHTNTLEMQGRLAALKDPGRPKNTQSRRTPEPTVTIEPSFLIPQMSDMSEIFTNDVTRFSAKRGAAAASHIPIDSIPIPQDERAVLTAMKLLQEKVANLEGTKAATEQRCLRLQSELRKAEIKFQQEQRKAQMVEEDFRRRRRADSAFGGSEDGDADEITKEKLNIEFQMEKLKLESNLTSLRMHIEDLTLELETAKIALRNVQEERNAAVNSVAAAIACNEDLKISNRELQNQLDRIRQEKEEIEMSNSRQRDEWKSREEKLRRRTREAREAAVLAEVAMKDAQKRDMEAREAAEQRAAAKKREERARQREADEQAELQRLEKEKHELRKAELQKEFDKKVMDRLKHIRPELFVNRSEPIVIPSGATPAKTTVNVDGKRRVIAMPKSRKSKRNVEIVEESSEVDITQTPIITKKDQGKGLSGKDSRELKAVLAAADAMDDTLPVEELKCIVDEVVQERKKRKAAKKAEEEARQKEEARRAEEARENEAALKAMQNKEKRVVYAEGTKLDTETTGSQSTGATTNGDQTAAPGAKEQSRRRKMVKVVYVLEDGDTEVLDLENEVTGSLTELLKKVDINALPVDKEPKAAEKAAEEPGVREPKAQSSSAPEPEGESFSTAQATAVDSQEGAASPREQEEFIPSLSTRLQYCGEQNSANHDPLSCTVCVRMAKLRAKEDEARKENPLADIDNSMLFPAPELEPASNWSGAEADDQTMRPSVPPKNQLQKVVRQLKDEFGHLKMTYQAKSEEFMSLDPSVGKKRRKLLTNEMNQLVEEMDHKCDQIYALYDVNEEFVRTSAGAEEGYESSEHNDEVEAGVGAAGAADETEMLIRSLGVVSA